MKAAVYLFALVFVFAAYAVAAQIQSNVSELTAEEKRIIKARKIREMLLKKCKKKCEPLKFTMDKLNKCTCYRPSHF
ncbi:hypothetical protein BDB01DRAFT_804051 [Pilobolus umbonatus]|nr:hypothetical protein BDB01DRAFT_804051 [Pilobolus umbonatus]